MIKTMTYLVLAAMVCAGCASIGTRRSISARRPQPKYVYPGVQVDAAWIASPFDERVHTDALYAGFAYPLFFVGLIDLPLSAALDTLCLPYDAYKVTIGGKTRYGKDELPTKDCTSLTEGAPSVGK
jgi:uncharacterized protein YceK